MIERKKNWETGGWAKLLQNTNMIVQPNPNPFGTHPFKHRILGVLALDTPFLGLHPGIIPTGIASLFRGSPENTSLNAPEPSRGQSRSAPDLSQEFSNISLSTTTSTSQFTDTITETNTQPTSRTSSDSIRPSTEATRGPPPPYPSEPSLPQDPHFNPPWFNDTIRRDRSFFKGIAHFTRKHLSEGVFNAAWKHVLSHMEYGSCLADYPGLHDRYNQLRALENVDDIKALTSDIVTHEPNFRLRPVRVRFTNYYTSSTGRIKPDKVEGKEKKVKAPSAENNEAAETRLSTPRISVEVHEDDKVAEPQLLPPIPIPEDDEDDDALREPQAPMEPEIEGLPDIPPPPTPPPQPPSPSSFPDKASRKQAEKEAKALQKEYERAVKAREKAIRQRNKLIEKHHRRQAKLASNQARTSADAEDDENDDGAGSKDAKKKPRKFCALPRKRNGEPDAAWVSVFMDGVDEVEAHCSLFLPDGPHYDRLVGDVAQRVVGWVQDDLTRRAIADMGVC